jgi:hypothetical protein
VSDPPYMLRTMTAMSPKAITSSDCSKTGEQAVRHALDRGNWVPGVEVFDCRGQVGAEQRHPAAADGAAPETSSGSSSRGCGVRGQVAGVVRHRRSPRDLVVSGNDASCEKNATALNCVRSSARRQTKVDKRGVSAGRGR